MPASYHFNFQGLEFLYDLFEDLFQYEKELVSVTFGDRFIALGAKGYSFTTTPEIGHVPIVHTDKPKIEYIINALDGRYYMRWSNRTEKWNGTGKFGRSIDQSYSRVKYVAFAPDNGWFILYRNGFTDWSRLPDALHALLQKKRYVPLQWISISPNLYWYVAYADGKTHYKLPDECGRICKRILKNNSLHINRLWLGAYGMYVIEYNDVKTPMDWDYYPSYETPGYFFKPWHWFARQPKDWLSHRKIRYALERMPKKNRTRQSTSTSGRKKLTYSSHINEPHTNEPDTKKSHINEPHTNESDTNESDTNESDTNETTVKKSKKSDKKKSKKSDKKKSKKSDTKKSDTKKSDTKKSEIKEYDTKESVVTSDANESDANESDANESDANESDANESDAYESDAYEPDTKESDTKESNGCSSESNQSKQALSDIEFSLFHYAL